MKNGYPISAIIIALNEADRIPRALASLSWVDQVVVVDAGSRDGTPELAAQAGAEVVHHDWEGYSKQKAFAVGLTRHQWVLWVDADEEVSPELRRSIEETLMRPALGERPSAYAMNRRTWYLGRFLRFGGWYPDRKVRLFNKARAALDGSLIHEGLHVDGPVGFLRGDLLHYSYRNLDHHIRKTHEMASLWAEQEKDRRRVAMLEMAIHPAAKAIKSYVLRVGFLEGWRGLVVAGMASYAVWLKYALLREAQLRKSPKERRNDAG